MKRLTVFNGRGGVGTTTTVFNIGHALARLGRSVLILDCDPQCELSTLVLSELESATVFAEQGPEGRTVAACLEQVRGGGAATPTFVELAERLKLLPGDLSLARLESSRSLDADLERMIAEVGEVASADVVLVDIGPSLGPLNRAVLRCCDAVAVAVAPDLFAARSLENVGAALRTWRTDPPAQRAMAPIGYIWLEHLGREAVPLRGEPRELPGQYARLVLGQDLDVDRDRLTHLRHYASLVPLARVARKPIFELKHADGVLGAQLQLVERARVEFTALAQKIVERLEAT